MRPLTRQRISQQSSTPAPVDRARLQRFIESTGKSGGANGFSDWLHGLADIGSMYGDLVHPGASTGFKAGKLLLDRVAPINNSSPKAVAKEVKKIEKEVKKEEKGIIQAARSFKNEVRPARQLAHRDGTVTLSGCDAIATLNSGTGCALGSVIYTSRINPATMGLNLPKVASMYERYKIHGKFKLAGGASTSTGGGLVSYIDYDPADIAPSGTGQANVTAALTHDGAVPTRLWEDLTLSLRESKEPPVLFVDPTSGDPRFCDAGRITIMCSQDIGAGVSIGQLFFHWTITLAVRSDDQGVVTGDVAYYAKTGSFFPTDKMGSDSLVYNTPGLRPIVTDAKAGYIQMPPGNYIIDVSLTGCAAGSFGVSAATLIQFSAEVLTDLSKNYTYGNNPGLPGVTAYHSHVWITARSSFTLQPMGAFNAGSFTGYQIFICATGLSPFGDTFRTTVNMMDTVASLQARTARLQRIQSGMNSASTSSVTSSSSSSTTSSGSVVVSSSTTTPSATYVPRAGWFSA
jgi:hypothetical protein